MYQGIKFKPGVDPIDFFGCSPNLILLLGHFALFCRVNKLACTITSITDNQPGRVTEVHAQGRAFDASVKGFTTDEIDWLLSTFNEKHKYIAAISKSDGKRRAVIYHRVEGGAHHLHFQVDK